MQLTYFRAVPNFGDALNPLLASSVLGEPFEERSATHILFIGTLIGRAPPRGCREIIIGAGAGYKRGTYRLDNRMVFCVRGPLTCDLLGIDRSYAAADPGILVSHHFAQASAGGIAFMPHHHTDEIAGDALAAICAEVGITYLSPLADTRTLLAQVAGASGLITEALHGAVAAESYGVPWLPVVHSSRVLTVKWQDFAATIGIDYQPADISTNIAFDGQVRPQHWAKHTLATFGLGKAKYRYLPVRKPTPTALRCLEDKLRRLKDGPFVRSDAATKARSIARLDDAISRFRDLCAAERLSAGPPPASACTQSGRHRQH